MEEETRKDYRYNPTEDVIKFLLLGVVYLLLLLRNEVSEVSWLLKVLSWIVLGVCIIVFPFIVHIKKQKHLWILPTEIIYSYGWWKRSKMRITISNKVICIKKQSPLQKYFGTTDVIIRSEGQKIRFNDIENGEEVYWLIRDLIK